MKNVLVVFMLVIATSCSSVKNFKDKSTDFSKYKTYEFTDQSKQMSGILVDKRTSNLVWSGHRTKVLHETYTPERTQKRIRSAVVAILSKYPTP